MASENNSSFEQQIDLGGLHQEKFVVIAAEAAVQLNWSVEYVSKSGLVATRTSDVLQVIVRPEGAMIRSECNEDLEAGAERSRRNVDEFISALETVSATATEQQLQEWYATHEQALSSTGVDLLAEPNAKTSFKDILSFFVPRKNYFVTPLLVDINILLFIIMVATGANILSPDGEYLIKWGANFRPYILDGQWWRLFTNMFLHIGILHLVINMYALVYIGLMLEPYLGKLRFAVAYVLAGIAGSVLSVYWHPLTLSAGASGAIFGMYGVFLSLLTTNVIHKAVRNALFSSIVIFVVLNLGIGIRGGIDNAAHIGGLIGGIIVGYIFYPSLIKPKLTWLKYITAGTAMILILVVSAVVCKSIPDDIRQYQTKMDQVIANEKMALQVFKLPGHTPAKIIIENLQNKGIAVWQQSIRLLTEADKLDIPDELHERNKQYQHYCELRIKSYQLIMKKVSENTTRYDAGIEACNSEIEQVINAIKAEK
ncbi:rhomboid family intramembrane serine protease [Mucilaginibacter sp. Bleaf8]|uniref:rhomboid family intramembrane serine protease n=1 Tax=Mucilaginibacter sp. Bleaf8 TaxID=2834430 RepID=UPI001BCF41EC|nr:rhomboid family intramembrane serine protease [Mucilaginibacter sp. Bleaf8]MBS7566028.1 rhomboid family intramembrane serine protease [Mucilaginibacter sp. Bleaf8]